MQVLNCTISPIDYDTLHNALAGYLNQLPLTSTNDRGESVIITAGVTDGVFYYRLDTLQENGWIRVNEYYADGTTTETYEK